MSTGLILTHNVMYSCFEELLFGNSEVTYFNFHQSKFYITLLANGSSWILGSLTLINLEADLPDAPKASVTDACYSLMPSLPLTYLWALPYLHLTNSI